MYGSGNIRITGMLNMRRRTWSCCAFSRTRRSPHRLRLHRRCTMVHLMPILLQLAASHCSPILRQKRATMMNNRGQPYLRCRMRGMLLDDRRHCTQHPTLISGAATTPISRWTRIVFCGRLVITSWRWQILIMLRLISQPWLHIQQRNCRRARLMDGDHVNLFVLLLIDDLLAFLMGYIHSRQRGHLLLHSPGVRFPLFGHQAARHPSLFRLGRGPNTDDIRGCTKIQPQISLTNRFRTPHLQKRTKFMYKIYTREHV